MNIYIYVLNETFEWSRGWLKLGDSPISKSKMNYICPRVSRLLAIENLGNLTREWADLANS